MRLYGAIFSILVSVSVYCGVKAYSQRSSGKCIQIFYDRHEDVTSLTKVLKVYPDYQLQLEKIADYQAGNFGHCQASLVVSTTSEIKIPKALLDDFLNSEKNISWVGMNIWQLGDQLEKTMGLRYMGQNFKRASLKDLYYHGRVLRDGKASDMKSQIDFLPVSRDKVEILIEARYVGNRELTPYLVRSKNMYYLADVNFGPAFQAFLADMIGVPPTAALSQLVGGL